jgi:DNA-binding NtrC family response regulator
LSEDALELLCAWSWPGNVRQLQNAVEMAIALSGERVRLTAEDFPLPATAAGAGATAALTIDLPETGLDYEQTIATFERSILEQALRKTGGNKKAAAEMLRLKRTTLSAKMRSLESAALRS